MTQHRGVRLGVVCVVALLAGCGALFGGGPSPAESAVTPAPVPTDGAAETTAVPDADQEYWGNASVDTNRSAVTQPRVLELRPNCERPPGLVVHIQVLALQNNDPATNEGINTTWQFASPSNRDLTGPYANFVRTIQSGFEPLLNATGVRYGPLDRDGDTASQPVTVVNRTGATTSYRWTVEKQTEAPYEGCWMTAGVAPA
ncbi:DUF4864 domain-containing protein [Haloarcula marismortui]|uniref:DUF4864 domain-containing protein n=1 Tax=Haloarcula marismortui ATCC 33800 TaxID=662476 RepID=M0K0Y7_9EURY|nr:DUF4864 domain-containing protein [Haloarcula sinaiiensis]EMA15082.1 hypothetical protein C436_04860 [Haloarcula sinaiiensis ATCC 33800]QUJ72057.1 DUF4864 domain-containing protein [Haloarcula sinaiiensis ATCC 33800]